MEKRNVYGLTTVLNLIGAFAYVFYIIGGIINCVEQKNFVSFLSPIQSGCLFFAFIAIVIINKRDKPVTVAIPFWLIVAVVGGVGDTVIQVIRTLFFSGNTAVAESLIALLASNIFSLLFYIAAAVMTIIYLFRPSAGMKIVSIVVLSVLLLFMVISIVGSITVLFAVNGSIALPMVFSLIGTAVCLVLNILTIVLVAKVYSFGKKATPYTQMPSYPPYPQNGGGNPYQQNNGYYYPNRQHNGNPASQQFVSKD